MAMHDYEEDDHNCSYCKGEHLVHEEDATGCTITVPCPACSKVNEGGK